MGEKLVVERYNLNSINKDMIETCFFYNKDYNKAYKLTKLFINKLNNQSKIMNVKQLHYDYYFCYMMLAKICNNNNFYAEAIRNIFKAKEYKTQNYFDYTAKWLLACIYRKDNQIEKAIKEYRECYDYYESIGAKRYMIGIRIRIRHLNLKDKKKYFRISK